MSDKYCISTLVVAAAVVSVSASCQARSPNAASAEDGQQAETVKPAMVQAPAPVSGPPALAPLGAPPIPPDNPQSAEKI